MKSGKKILLIPIFVAVYLLFILVSDYEKVFQVLQQANLGIIFLSTLVWSISIIFRGFRWNSFMGVITKNISLKRNMLYYFVGLTLNLTPGRIGEIIRCNFIKKDYQIPIAKTTAIIFVERFYELLIMSVIISSVIFVTDTSKWILILPLCILCFLIIIKNRKLFFKISNFFSRFNFLKNLTSNLEQMFEITNRLTKPDYFIRGTLWSFAIVVTEAFGVFVIFHAFNSEINFIYLIGIFQTSQILAVISMIPLGLGVWEGSFISLLKIGGISEEVGISVSLLVRLVSLGIASFFGFVGLQIITRNKK